MRKRARVDGNQRQIVATLRQCGWSWIPTHQLGDGYPDGIAFKARGPVRLVEIKRPTGTLTPAQVRFHQIAPVVVLRSVDDALALQ